MHLIPFPGCCTAGIITGFGGTGTAEHRFRPVAQYDENTMFEETKTLVEQAHRNNWAMVFATTNSEQKLANKVLPRIGFQKIEETAKLAHKEFTLFGWVFRLNPSKVVAPLKVPKNPFARKDEEEGQVMVEQVRARVNNVAMVAIDDLEEVAGEFGAVVVEQEPPIVPPPDNWEYMDRKLARGAVYGPWYRSGFIQIRDLVTRDGIIIAEIHPNDVGRGMPEILDRNIRVRIAGRNTMQVRSHKMQDFQWVTDIGAITHFRFV